MVEPNWMICSINERLTCSLSSRPSRYSIPCFLKHHLMRWGIEGDTLPSCLLLRTLSSMALISVKTALLSSRICSATRMASIEWTELDWSRTAAVCFKSKEKRVTFLDMVRISVGALAISQLTALRMSERRKPAPAMPVMEVTVSSIILARALVCDRSGCPTHQNLTFRRS